MKRLRLVIVFVMCSSLVTTWASPASAAYWKATGTITCPSGQPIVGVWIQAGTQSGWATYRNDYYRGRALGMGTYSKNFGAYANYRATVGCGGTPSRWGSSHSSSNLFPFPILSPHLVCQWGYCVAFSY